MGDGEMGMGWGGWVDGWCVSGVGVWLVCFVCFVVCVVCGLCGMCVVCVVCGVCGVWVCPV